MEQNILNIQASQPQWANEAVKLLLAETRSKDTRNAYTADIEDFFVWQERTTSPESVIWLCSTDAGQLSLLLNGYKAHLRERTLSEATINRRLSAIRSLLRFARRLGATNPDPTALVTNEKVRRYRDTRGPGIDAIVQILSSIDRSKPMGKRDYALVRLLCENALRRGELHKADIADFEPGYQRLWILGKGQGSQKEAITLSQETTEAIALYLQDRNASGEVLEPTAPLFLSCGRGTRSKDGRLTGRGIAGIITGYGKRVLGIELHPHALRHTAITATLDATGGDIRTAQRLSRHRDIRTLMIYDDNREDLQGNATRILSKLLSGT